VLTLDGSVVTDVVATALPSHLVTFDVRVLFAVMAAVTLLGLVRLAFGLCYLDSCRRRATELQPMPDQVQALQHRFGLQVPFAVSDRLSVPLTFGWARPIVLVPPAFGGLTADEQEGVACHELLHVHRRDWPATVLEEVIRAFLWFHPAVWLLLAKIVLSREQVVDAGTVRITGKRQPYLDALWRIICSCRMGGTAVAVPLIGRSHLRARVEHLRQETTMTHARIFASAAILAAVLIVAGVGGASVFASPETSASDALLAASDFVAGSGATRRQSGGDHDTAEKLETKDFEGECSEITHPVMVDKVNPSYPEEARKEGVRGLVVVRAVVTDKGVVDEMEILQSPDERLSQAAMDAIGQWRFEPALCDGKPVSVYYNLTVKFNLE
jgi:TonB family protein